MSDFWNYEVKETVAFGGNFHPPNFSPHYPIDTDCVIGICYKDDFPKYLMEADEAYQRALTAKYYYWNTTNTKWEFIGNTGGPEDFLLLLSRMHGENYPISWPDPFEHHHRFNRTDCYQIQPYRELIRRHFDQYSYVTDRDFMIYKRRRR